MVNHHSTERSVIQQRQYQEKILSILKENWLRGYHTIAEVDTGLGKRVLTYLLIKDLLPKQRVLLLLHSTLSFSETIHYFKEEYGGFRESDFQAFSSRTPSFLRKKILENARIVASTPQTFSNAFKKFITKPIFDVVIINEIDKIVRRHGDSRLLIYPYNTLIPYFVQSKAWIVGMTGTIRDDHIFFDFRKETIEIQQEIVTLNNSIPGLHIIRMDSLLAQTDIQDYIQNTFIQRLQIDVSPELKTILDLIDQAIKNLRQKIIDETLEEKPTLLEAIPSSQLALVSGMLESESGDNQKYHGLLLIRKYCTAMQPKKFRRFLYRLKKFGVTKELIKALPEKTTKIKAVHDLIKKQPPNSKTVVLCSFLDTASCLQEETEKRGIASFLITGQVRNKIEVLNKFKREEAKAVLVMTAVGERDIDIPQANLMIVYDVVNTVKTMYQRFKRTRGGLVICLCYRETFEERKVNRLLQEISKRYPWSSMIA
ncbi:MAG: DEAD/DEAH box helicase family protein [Candidatus Heimdallarchaeota archaeon]|nr:MAG: DEAD/DEAH box helicase family protein [Candidatus Heimdallarchaeota archaeon]